MVGLRGAQVIGGLGMLLAVIGLARSAVPMLQDTAGSAH
jgi:hypothetical protein